MITSADFSKLSYKKPFLKSFCSDKKLSNIIGLDTEAYSTGTPFMICLSNKTFIDPLKAIETLTKNYIGTNFALYNMKYDAGALLYNLPLPVMKELWRYNEVTYNDIKIKYLPHKYLEFRVSRRKAVKFWDFAQFYKMSLDNAAKTYLNKSKLDLPTKTFSRRYVKNHFSTLKRYCIQDALLTKELAEYFLNKLETFGITASKVYSCASVAFQYFVERKAVSTVSRYWKYHKPLLQYATDAYQGGKFEITARGYLPQAYEYDITSAYPHEIANLWDVSRSKVVHSKKYLPDAHYGFMRVCIRSDGAVPLPCGIKLKDEVRIYPSGTIYLTITKNEYTYLIQSGVDVQFFDGYFIYLEKEKYPYKLTVETLFDIKDTYKKTDRMLYQNCKIIMNSKYGKMAQVIKDPKTSDFIAGAGWHPIYASVITANTRLAVTRMQKLLRNHCLAVHTDSIITDEPIPDHLYPGGLGNFSFETSGETVIIGCGVYQIGDALGTKGIRLRRSYYNKPDTWLRLLKRSGRKQSVFYPVLHVESWCEAMARNHDPSKINLFEKIKKQIDFNCDVKRVWNSKTNAKKLLSSLEYSLPKHVHENKPENW